MDKIFYKPKELKQMGYPINRVLELCRSGKIGRKSNPEADRGYHYLITLKEIERYFK